MILSLQGQALIFLAMAATGFCIGFCYDIFRIFRKIVRHPDILTKLEDMLFWPLILLAVFYFLLNGATDEIRFYMLAGAVLGLVIYMYSLSRLVMAVSEALINLIKKILLILFKIIMAPFKLFLRILRVPANFIAKIIKNMLGKIKYLLHKAQKWFNMYKYKLKFWGDHIDRKPERQSKGKNLFNTDIGYSRGVRLSYPRKSYEHRADPDKRKRGKPPHPGRAKRNAQDRKRAGA